jgi:serine protease Do
MLTLTPDVAHRLGVPSGTRGVAVTDVDPGGLADRLGLEQGDVIVSVNRQPAANVAVFQKLVKSLSPERRGVVGYFPTGSVPCS